MFVGHAAVALAARKKARSISLGWLVAAAFGLDLLWPLFLLVGLERVSIVPGITAASPLRFDHYPWSHSLLMTLAWSLVAYGLARWRGVSRGTSGLLGVLVLSHWILDAVVHRPDLPLWPGASPLVGLGLWDSIPGSLLLEGTLFGAGIVLYVRATRPTDRTGVLAFWSWILLMTAMWLPGPFSPPPPGARAVAWVSLGMWLLPFWAAWADRHRAIREPAGGASGRVGAETAPGAPAAGR